MTQTPAKGIIGHFLYDANKKYHFFRVYSDDKKSYKDYDFFIEDIKVQILSEAALIEGEGYHNRLDWLVDTEKPKD